MLTARLGLSIATTMEVFGMFTGYVALFRPCIFAGCWDCPSCAGDSIDGTCPPCYNPTESPTTTRPATTTTRAATTVVPATTRVATTAAAPTTTLPPLDPGKCRVHQDCTAGLEYCDSSNSKVVHLPVRIYCLILIHPHSVLGVCYMRDG